MKTKRFIALLTVMALLVLPLGGLTALAADATSGTWQNGFTWTLDSDGTLTVDGQGAMFDPPSDYDVDGMDKYNRRTRISPWCCDTRIRRVAFTGNVTSIGNYAFYGCSRLESVAFPAGLQRIGTHCFEATPLTEAAVPDTVTVIDQYAFQTCRKLVRAHLPASLQGISLQTFRFCGALESVEIPADITYIGNWAFDGCDSLRDVTYAGSRSQWEAIRKERTNDPLFNATIRFLGNAAQITSQPVSTSGAVGETARFSVGATGDALSYQWYFKKANESAFTAWNKHTSASVSTPVYASWHKAQFYCLVKAADGTTAKTNTVTLTVVPKITSQPVSASGAVNDTVKFTVKATGAGLYYQWYYRKSGAPSWTPWYSAEGSPSATLTAYKSWNGAKFYCKVTDMDNRVVKTDTVTLTVK